MEGLNLKVSRVKLFESNKMRAFVDLTINDSFVVRGLRVVEGSHGLFAAMPSKQGSGGKYDDIFFPITKESREMLQSLVLEAYEKEKAEGGSDSGNSKSFEEEPEDLPF